MQPFTVSRAIEDKDVCNLLVSALEGGSNYWYMIEESVQPKAWTFSLWREWKPGTKSPYFSDVPFNEGGALIFSVKSEERDEDLARKEEAERYTLDREAMQRGLTLMAAESPRHYADFIAENDDAITADVWLQYCLFGEVKFG